jgi:hypothetical protein
MKEQYIFFVSYSLYYSNIYWLGAVYFFFVFYSITLAYTWLGAVYFFVSFLLYYVISYCDILSFSCYYWLIKDVIFSYNFHVLLFVNVLNYITVQRKFNHCKKNTTPNQVYVTVIQCIFFLVSFSLYYSNIYLVESSIFLFVSFSLYYSNINLVGSSIFFCYQVYVTVIQWKTNKKIYCSQPGICYCNTMKN